ncbi:MAG: 16S rRNA (cytosine(1402)-N(4))-methyltransferase RsmH, partial [Phycisphaerales bacterium]|nr:16S rRNA (cytosine(1402)-N(4))-methyltransferase RsmH [Phycisphaerales bacterium]
ARPMAEPAPTHIPVLMQPVLELLSPQPGDTVVDATAGLGGHAAAMAALIGPSGTLVLFDLDAANLQRAAARVAAFEGAPRVIVHHTSFSDSPRTLAAAGLSADVLLADLGFASPQVDDATRGFSFSRDGPLDMRLNPAAPITAAELVNTLPELELAELIRDFGEEPWPLAKRIASKIGQSRATSPISTTAQLATTVRSALPPRRPGHSIDPATKTFQALRIAVNDELGSLSALLSAVERAASMGLPGAVGGARSWLKGGARVGVISFHSLEDRPVKQCFARLVERGAAAELTRKPVTADDQELGLNPRARSAKLRVIRLS